MAGKFNSFLKGAASGFLTPKGYMGDWQHAARTFVDDYFRLAPKAKFLYHAYFDINPGAIKFPQLDQRHRTELGLLVRQVDFPRFNIKTVTLNQYNRKKVVQLTHDYGPMTFRFIDDRANIVNMLWQSYYNYYFADPAIGKLPGAYNDNAMKSFDFIPGPYGLDNDSSAKTPFFNQIILYQLNKKEYVSYTLINPKISSFAHDNASSSDQGTSPAECQMTVSFEAVTYDVGSISSGNVKGFAQDHYDNLPSPLNPLGGGSRSVFGAGGVFDGVATAADQFAKGNILNAVAAAANTVKNAKNISKATVRNELSNLATNAAVNAVAIGASVIKGTSFPGVTQRQPTTASPRTDLPGGT